MRITKALEARKVSLIVLAAGTVALGPRWHILALWAIWVGLLVRAALRSNVDA